MSPAGNIWRYQLFQGIWLPAFFTPVVVLFWEDNGLDRLDIYVLQGLFAVAVVLLEVPTGMVADRLGKRQSLLWGTAAIAVGLLTYTLGTGFWAFLVGEVILALGVTLLSGADSALLYDTLVALGRPDEFTRLEGRARGIQMASMALCNVAGGFLGEYSLRATVGLTAVGPVLAFVVAIGFVEAGSAASPPGRAARPRAWAAYRALLASAFSFVIAHRLVRWHLLFFAVITGTGTWLLWLYQPYMEWTGLPVWGFGLAFAGLNLFAAVASQQAHRVESRLGEGGTLMALAALQLVTPVAMALVAAPAGIACACGQQAVRGMTSVVVSGRVLRHAHADERATVLSLQMLGARLFFALSAPFIGLVAREQPLPVTLFTQAGLLLACLLALLLARPRLPPAGDAAASPATPPG